MKSYSLTSIAYACTPSALHPMLQRIERSDTGSRLAKGMFWSMAGSTISRGLMLCATILVARMLGKTTYGELGMIQSTVGLFGVLAGFQLGLMATKHVAELREKDPERAGRIIGLSSLTATLTGGVMAALLLIFAPWLAENTLSAPHLGDVLRIGAIMLFLNSLNGAQTGALSGFEAFKTIAYVNLFVGLISFPMLVIGAYFGGLPGAVVGLAVNLCFNWLFNHLALRKEAKRFKVPLSFKDCLRERSVLISFSLPAALSSMIVPPAMWGSRVLLANQPGGYDELGLFTAAIIFQMPLLFISSTIAKPLLSILSNAGDKISDNLSTLNILSSWSVGLVAAIPLLCFPEVLQVILGKEYAGQGFRVTFSLVVFYTTILIFMSGLARVIVARGMLWWGFLSGIIWASVLMSSALVLAKWGAVGLAWAFFAAYISEALIMLPIYFKKKLFNKKDIVSSESILVWVVIAILTLLNIFDVSLFYRAIVFIPSILAVGILLKKIVLNPNKK